MPGDGIARSTLRRMRRRRLHRLTTAFFVVLSVLFSQLALANYVCPHQADAAAMVEMMAAGQPCEGMDSAQPVLCAEHAKAAAQSLDTVKAPTPSLPAVVQMLELPFELAADAASALPAAVTPEARPPPGRLFLSTLRLRV
jgi:hypothetical protein